MTVLYEHIVRQAAQSPHALALVSRQGSFSYHELNLQVNRRANYLLQKGVQQGDIIAVHCGRTPEAILSILAVQKTGAAYLPLDPLYPRGRINHMIGDSGAKIILTTGNWAADIEETGALRLQLDTLSETLQAQSGAEPPLPEDPQRPFYVIYTSGSTGQPKGAMVRYDAFQNLVEWYIETLSMTARDRLLLVTSLAFDLTQKNIIAPLVAGGTLCLAAEEGFDPAEILDAISASGITVMNCTPTHIYTLVEQASETQLHHLDLLRRLTLGGEALELARLKRWWSRPAFNTALMNSYGPTECTGIVSYYPIPDPRVFDGKPVPITTPIPNASLHVLDEAGIPVKPGEQGELYIAGLCVGMGYLHRPDLTAERFVACDLPSARGKVAYRTGDLCQLDDHGDILFLGRMDQQVKIRGLRIELGEIEAAIRECPGVRDIAVSPVSRNASDVRLVGYLIQADPARPVSFTALRAALRGNLPDYMIPAHFMTVDAFPMTPSGKLDRKNLPLPDWNQVEAERELVALETETETKLAALFAEVLGVERIGATDDFFGLGGHSLSALRVLTRIQDQFGVKLSLRVLFDASTVRALAACIEAAPQNRATLSSIPLLPIPRDQEMPLSFAQQRLWFLEQYQPGLTAYNCASALHITGPLVVPVLEKALNEIVRRHEILRTTFVLKDERAVQQIRPHAFFALERDDYVTGVEGDSLGRARHAISCDAQRPYDLRKGPLFRFKLLKRAENEHILSVQFHHIVFDGWSANVLMDEMAVLYQAFLKDQPSPLPELTLQYADYAAWQEKVFQGEPLNAALAYWRTQLQNLHADLDLPTDHPRPAVQTYSGETIRLVLPNELSEALRKLSQKEGVTLFTTLLAAWRIFLYRYTGQSDMVVGSAVAGRTQATLEKMIGFFVNMLAIRMEVSGNPGFVELLHREHETTLTAYDNQDIPFDAVVAALLPSRDPSRSPLFQVAFAGQNTRTAPMEFAGLSMTAEELGNQTSKFDLTLYAVDAEDGIILPFEFNTALFERATMLRWTHSFQVMLENIIRNPDQPIETIPLLDDQERQQILVEWNKDVMVPYPHQSSIPELFEAEVAAHPETVALVADTVTWTYRELNARANVLAHFLRSRKGGAGTFVGLCMERSPAMIAATLGILKAGAAYVPLDPAYPPARLQLMLEDTKPVAIFVSSRAFTQAKEAFASWKDLVIDVDAVLEQGGIHTNGPLTAGPEDLAYVMYTSGSTGIPKGVCIPHRGVIRLVKGANYASLDATQTFFHFAPISFDASTFEIWGALLNGAKLVVYPAELPSIAEIGDAIQRYNVTTLWLTAGLFHQMIESYPESLLGVRQLLAGGDVLSVSHVRRVLDHLPDTTMINGYGPTECTTFTCCYPMHRPVELGTNVPIGRPISNTPIYILDAHQQPVPIGVTGELYVGGDGVAREYLNAPELTAQRFIPNPFGAGRLYKTGDQVRYLPDGRVLFLGRADGQIKLRGFRVEPGEIEATLLSHSDVSEAAVLLQVTRAGDKRLVAFVVARQSESPDIEALRQYCCDRLPAHMVPTDMVCLPKLPLTPNGKLDRQALEKIQIASRGAADTYAPPRTAQEEQLVRLWEQLLDQERIGIQDNFFRLGGHSLLAIRLVDAMRILCHVELSIRDLFECPTIFQLSDRMQKRLPVQQKGSMTGVGTLSVFSPKGGQEDQYLEQLRPGTTNPPFVCVTGAGSVTGYYAALADRMSPTQPFYGLKDTSFDQEYECFPTVEKLAERYIQSLRTIQPQGPYYLGGWSFGGIVALEMAQQLTRQGETIALLALLDTAFPKQEKGPARSRGNRAKTKLKHLITDIGMLWGSGPILARYAWDMTGLVIGLLCGHKRSVSLREYVQWAWHDIHTQYKRRKTNPAKFRLRDSRLHMIEDPFVRLVFKTMRARKAAMMAYTCKPYSGAVTLISASDTARGRNHTLGWEEIVRGDIVVHELKGDHESILREPYVSETAKVLQQAIDATMVRENPNRGGGENG